MGTVSLTEFLAARLDEEAAGAWAVHDVSRCDALLYADLPADAPLPDAADCECGYPARVLRQVKAGRKILAEHVIHSEYLLIETVHHDPKWHTGWVERKETGHLDWWCSTCDADPDYGHIGAPEEGCPTLRTLAAVWSDHPDYQQEWSPAWRDRT